MKHREMCALIIRNLKDFDAAARLWEEELWPEIDTCLQTAFETWATNNKWRTDKCKFNNYYEIAPTRWQISETEFIASIYLLLENNDNDSIGGTSYELANICKIHGHAGIALYINAKRKEKSEISREFLIEMKANDFNFSENEMEFYIPFQLNNEVLAYAMENGDYKSMITNLVHALLNKIEASNSLVEKFVSRFKPFAFVS